MGPGGRHAPTTDGPAAHVLFRTDKVRRGLLIVPASLKDQWLQEWRLFTDVQLSVVDGRPAGRAAVYRSTQRGFLVTNYEQVLRDLDLIQRWRPDLEGMGRLLREAGRASG